MVCQLMEKFLVFLPPPAWQKSNNNSKIDFVVPNYSCVKVKHQEINENHEKLKKSCKKSSKIENSKYPRGRARSARPLGASPKAALCCFQCLHIFVCDFLSFKNDFHGFLHHPAKLNPSFLGRVVSNIDRLGPKSIQKVANKVDKQ